VYTETLIDGLVSATPPLVGWTAAVILAIILLKRRGTKAERFLLIGAAIKLFKAGIDIIAPSFNLWLTAEQGLDAAAATNIIRVFDLCRESIGLGGIIVLVVAFWIKFMSQHKQPPET
jgi:hypothetical protein